MREIKFRAWRKTLKEMMEWEDLKHWEITLGEDEDHILMQYTGLKDKNGKEIYEGDIVKGCLKGVGICDLVVKYNLTQGFYPLQSNFFSGEEEREVIGNIYENPELLKN